MRLFSMPRHRSIQQKKKEHCDRLPHILAPSVIGIILCTICLCGASWAWFTASTSTGAANIQSATYTVSVTAKQGETVISPTIENGITTVRFSAAGTYTVTLTPTGTAKTGYCKLTFDGTGYYTPQLVSERFTFTVNAVADTALTVTPQWGTYSGAATIQNGGKITAAGYQQNSSQTTDNSVTTEPAAPATPSSPPSESETGDTAEPTPTPEPSTSDDTAASADSATQTTETTE